jgi:hypothetical protein
MGTNMTYVFQEKKFPSRKAILNNVLTQKVDLRKKMLEN